MTRARPLLAAALAAALGCNTIAGIHEGIFDACLEDPAAPGCDGQGGAPTTTTTTTSSGDGGATTTTGAGMGGTPVCGDDIVAPLEECDDGNTTPGDGCAADCTVECDGPDMHEAPASHHCYWLSDKDKVDWTTARDSCAAQGGYLATITSDAELQFVLAFVVEEMWIGANDMAKEGTFVWSNGEPFAWTKWAPGAPNTQNPDEDCVRLVPNEEAFNDMSCSQGYRFLCERSAPGSSL